MTATPSLADTDFSGDVGPKSIKESFTNYVQRVRGGDVGMLPAIGGLIVLLIIFANVSDKFLTKTNLANLITQAAPIILLGMALVWVLLLGRSICRRVPPVGCARRRWGSRSPTVVT